MMDGADTGRSSRSGTANTGPNDSASIEKFISDFKIGSPFNDNELFDKLEAIWNSKNKRFSTKHGVHVEKYWFPDDDTNAPKIRSQYLKVRDEYASSSVTYSVNSRCERMLCIGVVRRRLCSVITHATVEN